jgi:hypothetical protein
VLIPSVSSKGFPIHEDGLSETAKILEFASPDIQEALLVSAYDIHHRYLQDVDRMLGADHGSTIYGTPKLLVVDSGGYELNPQDWEGGETRRGTYVAQPYDEADFHSVTDQLPQDRPLLVVSYDDPRADQATYSEQRERAQAFFAPRPHLLSDFLLKPAPNEWVINIDGLTSEANNLAAFHVVGVTEKDLGDDLLTRLKTLARLRTLLDEHGCENKPIHVFGSLDPLWTPLYFMAGAELFDGLSWMRYAYHEGLAIHPDELAVLTSQLDASQQRRHQLRFMSNLTALGKIRRDLIRWAAEPDDWGHLGPHSDLLRQIYSTMCAELGQRG